MKTIPLNKLLSQTKARKAAIGYVDSPAATEAMRNKGRACCASAMPSAASGGVTSPIGPISPSRAVTPISRISVEIFGQGSGDSPQAFIRRALPDDAGFIE